MKLTSVSYLLRLCRVLCKCSIVLFSFLFVKPAGSQTVIVDSSAVIHTVAAVSSDTVTTDTSNEVRSFEEFNMPPEMIEHFEQITPREMTNYQDEFQVTQMDDSEQELVTVKLWYSDNHLLGYIFESPLDNTSQATLSKFTVNIPLEWCCTPPNTDHPQHCVKDIMSIKLCADTYKCKSWHLKMPIPEAPVPKAKNEKGNRKKSKKANKPVAAPAAENTTTAAN